MRSDFSLRRAEDLCELVEAWGVVPFFKNGIPGFSVAEHCPADLWFTDSPGPWEWKGPVIRATGAAYGKFFGKRAAWIRRDLFCHFANFRRDGYDFDARFDDGLASWKEKKIFDLAANACPVLSTRLRMLANEAGAERKSFDAVVTGLQMKGYLLCSDFVYSVDKNGQPYGWGTAELSTPEAHYGEAFCRAVYAAPPERSREILAEAIRAATGASDTAASRFIR